MQLLNGQVAIITGAAKGIGVGIASVLRAEGATVVLADVDQTAADAAANTLDPTGEHVMTAKVDVTSDEDLRSLAARTIERFGRIDILAANAGIYPHVPLNELRPDTFDELMAVNVRGSVFAVQACLPAMRERNYGRIVLTSSITGSLVGQRGYSHYGSSKAAMLGFMRCGALEVADAGITINAVLPGNIRTPGFDDLGPEHEAAMLAAIPLGRFGDPEDVGWAVRFLAAPEAGYITGQTLVVDGGQVLPESA